MHIVVGGGRNLIAKDSGGTSDPYVVVELLVAEKRDGKWSNIKVSHKTKTPVIQKELNPDWNFQAFSLFVFLSLFASIRTNHSVVILKVFYKNSKAYG